MNQIKESPFDDMLCFDVYAVNLAFGRIYKPLLDPLGLTYSQYLVLMSLWTQDDQTVGQIGGGLGLDSSTLTPLIKRIEAAGLVVRNRDPLDERRVIVSLTDQGRALQAHSSHIRSCVVSGLGMSLEELQQLQAMIRKLRKSIVAQDRD
ncbi:MAG: MarR family winged helix-turn-helix transcriptional regulator [Paracoccus sp. (in: a-proteobacteria)]|uniref:MarR family winged helix-turn-helix transcriptional regulator n=1 Tax=Paracoccus TaxID=265 RepID=UPI00272D529D|nr:MarR family winged helix-turn-helix transcriptional regulator [Paracoccus sediminilitoris]